MAVPAFEAVIDHRSPAHHEQMDALTRDLGAWVKKHRCVHVLREETPIRPGVIKLRFYPDPAARQAKHGGDTFVSTR